MFNLPTPASILRSNISFTVHADARTINAAQKHLMRFRRYASIDCSVL